MNALKQFETKYKFNPFEFIDEINTKFFGTLKSINFDRLIGDELLERYNITADETFFQLLVESFQEAKTTFPQSKKISYGSILQNLSVHLLNPNVPDTKGYIADFLLIVSNDDLRPATTGVYFDDDYIVGTDAHTLIKDFSPNILSKKYNKKIVNVKDYVKSKGKVIRVIDDRFPNYDAVIPTDNFQHIIDVDLYYLFDLSKSAEYYYKILDVNAVSLHFTIKGEEFAVNPKVFSRVIEYFLRKGINEAKLYYTANNRAILLKANNLDGLIMPIWLREEKEYSVAETKTYDLEKADSFEIENKDSTKKSSQQANNSILEWKETIATLQELIDANDSPESNEEWVTTIDTLKELIADSGYSFGGKISLGDNVNVIAENRSGVVTNIISNGKHFSVKFVDGTKKIYDLNEIEKILSDENEFADGGVTKNLKRIVSKGKKYGNLAINKAKPKAKRIIRKAKLGFDALAKKVAKAYEGKAVAPKYQKEYGKRYSKQEAQEVGNKVAAKVKRLKGM